MSIRTPDLSPAVSIPSADLNWLAGGGEMGELIRSMDWSATALGPLSEWPQSLRTSVSLCLSSTFPILVCWGPDDIQIYNDAYRPICGDLHPASMGAPFKVVWASALPMVGDAFERAHQGEGAYIKDQHMELDRNGYLEEANMTFSFSPIRDESGAVGGIFHPITETTAQVIGGRRTQLLRDLSASLAPTRSIDEIGRQFTAHAAQMAPDVPFLLFYELDEAGGALHLRGNAGLPAEHALAPPTLLLDDACWPFARSAASHAAERIDGLGARLAGTPCGPYAEAPGSALVLPLSLPGQDGLFGFLVAGVSVRRALDAEYRNFYELLRAAADTAIGNVIAYEREQQRAEERAQIDHAKTAFFSNVSHEFRTPLTLILGPLDDALSDTHEPLAPGQRKRIDVTHRNALRLLKLVNSLLDFSRIEAGRVQASYVAADLALLTLDLAGVFESAMAKGGLAYHVELAPLREPVYVDRDMWEKIVFNLLSNAFKFTLAGSVTVRLAEHEGMARLSVIDTGTGVPAHELPRMFERFHRIEGAPGRTYEGTGIGLALIQELVRLHGGTIGVSSVFGEGTRFDVDLPFGQAHLPQDRIEGVPDSAADRQRMGAAFVEEALRWLPDEQDPPCAPARDDAAPQDRREAVRPRILIADDNNDMRAYLKSLLEPHAEVRACADGEAAFAQLLADPPDLLVSDVMMPKLDGFGLIARIRASEALRLLPVMLLSARAGEEAKVEGLQAGADDYLVKPFSANELLARIRTQIALGRERRQGEIDARAREVHVRAMIDASPAMLWITDNEGRCTYLSQRWYDYTGRSPEQDLGLGWLENVHPDDRQRSREIVAAAHVAREPFSFDYRLRRQDGSYRWFIDAGLPRTDAHGQPDGYVGTVIDIHARKLLQDRFERVSEAGDIGVWYADAPFDAFQINAEMALHFGLQGGGQASARQLFEAVDPDHRERLRTSVEHAVRAGAPLDIEFRCVGGGDRAPRWLRAIGWCGLDEHGCPERFDGVTLDIDSQKHAEQELQRLAHELGEKNRMQSEFLFTLAHELRNPLAPIRSGLELLRSGAAGSEVQAIMRRQVDHMVHLVDDLLDMARLAEGKVTLRLERAVLEEVVREAVEMSRPLIEAGQHALAISLPDEAVVFSADRHRVAQVLGNLLNNAAKYTPPGGAIAVTARMDGADIAISVSDNGIGLAPDMLETVFDMYAQVHSAAGMAQGGLGVGLNLVRRLVALHGGRVGAESGGPGQGSSFTVWLPLPREGMLPMEMEVVADLPVEAAPAGSGLDILVVDDNVDAAETLQALLEINGHTVVVAHDGAAALALAEARAPQVVFLDIGLPDMSGHDAATAMRRLPGMAGATLVALTGWGAEQDRQRSSQAGFDHHLTKPADFDIVERLIGEVAAQRAGR